MPPRIYTVRKIKMRPARRKAQEYLRVAVLRGLRKGWRVLYPNLRTLRKQDDFLDDWVDEFVAELQAAFRRSALALMAGEAAWYKYLGMDVTYDPEYVIANHNIGEKITRITESTRAWVSNEIREWWGTDKGLYDLIDKLSPEFGEYRAMLIAVTESTSIASTVSDEMMLAAGITTWTWETAMDDIVCVFCGDMGGKEFPRTATMPPDASHPGCRCGVSPVIR